MPRARLFLPLLLVAALLGGCSSWRDYMPLETLRETDNQAPPTELTDLTPRLGVRTLWSQDTGDGAAGQRVNLVPALAGGRLFTADRKGGVRAMNQDGGQLAWTVDTGAPISGGPGLGDGLVLLGTSDAEVIALAEEDGGERWRTRVSSEVLAVPRASGGMVVVHTIDGKLYGLNASDGTQQWVYDRTAPVLTLRGSSSPVIVGDQVITGFPNGKLVNLDLRTGNPNWEVTVTPPRGRTELERIVDIDADPLVIQGIVFVVSFQGELAAVAQNNGTVLWRRELSSSAGLNADWRQLYATDAKSRVWAADPRNGSALWKQDGLLNRRLTAPAVLNDAVLVGDLEGYVHFLSQEDGGLLARVKVSGAPISAMPLVDQGVAYVLAEDGELTALSTSSEP